MQIIGLTGGIASGKSTVSTMLRGHGAVVLDADAIYHGLIAPAQGGAPSQLARRIESRFPGVLKPDATVDRQKLGEWVFNDPQALDELGAITHPAVAIEFARQIHNFSERGERVAIYDVPLLFERGLEGGLDGVLVVWVPRELQRTRLMGRDGLGEAAANRRVDAQLSLDIKRTRATWVIDNSGSLDSTQRQVDHWWTVRLARVGAKS